MKRKQFSKYINKNNKDIQNIELLWRLRTLSNISVHHLLYRVSEGLPGAD